MDMVFTVRQLVDKANEHCSKLFLLFIDLKKAYDSVPRKIMWRALEKLRVPHTLIDLVWSFHEGMKACVLVNEELLEEIDVRMACNRDVLWHQHCLPFIPVLLWSTGVSEWYIVGMDEVGR